MILRGMLRDRMPLVEQLMKEQGKPAVYSGAPSFRYTVGDYVVLRDGTLDVPDKKADKKMIGRLIELGLLECGLTEKDGIAFSTEGFSGRTLVNIVGMLHARGDLINKAIGEPNAFHMSTAFVRAVKERNPDTVRDFMEVLYDHKGFKAIRGLYISESLVHFIGFSPWAPDNEKAAHRALADSIVRYALENKWTKAEAPDATNEKYSFRIWLNAIGMTGDEYKTVRETLLCRLKGDSTFRLPEQKEAYLGKLKMRGDDEPEFVLL